MMNMDKKVIKGKNYISLIQIYGGKIYQEVGINDGEIEKWLDEIGIPKLNLYSILYPIFSLN